MPSSPLPLQLNQVTKSYGRSRGIVDVSFSLKPSEVFGFLGPNGAGKTTTIRTILNFIRPTNGSISVFGMDSVRDSVAIKRQVGYLAGNVAMYEHLTGSQLITFLASLHGQLDTSYVAQLASHFEADLSRPIKQLSKGNQQKIGLIQAFMTKPQLLILDEPTSGLDPLMQERFYESIKMARQDGATILISSHNLNEVQRICDRVAFIKDGQIISLEDIAKLKHLAVNHFIVTFTQPIKPTSFDKVEAVSEVKIDKNVGHFVVQGHMDEFVKTLAKHSVESIEINQASLEDIFMRHYQTKE